MSSALRPSYKLRLCNNYVANSEAEQSMPPAVDGWEVHVFAWSSPICCRRA